MFLNYRLKIYLLAVLIVISFALLMIPNLLPEKTFTLPLNRISVDSIYDNQEEQATALAEWIDFDKIQWRCTVEEVTDETWCGFSLRWSNSAPYEVFDFTDYDFIRLNLAYEGPTNRVGIFIINRGDADLDSFEIENAKSNSFYIRSEDISKPLEINMDEFRVAEWWIEENNISRQNAKTQIDSILGLDIAFGNNIEPGIHNYSLAEMVLVGKWVNQQTMDIWVLGAWLLGATGWIVFSLINLRNKTAYYQQRLYKEQTRRTEFQQLAITDPLTRLLNREGMNAQVDYIIKKNNSLDDFCLMFLDLDFFKQVNDKWGHHVGDIVLADIAQLLTENLRSDDIIARWGGEEFVLLTRNKLPENNIILAEKIRKLLVQNTFSVMQNETVTISIGIAFVASGEAFKDALKRADLALYKAKESGRNCYRVSK